MNSIAAPSCFTPKSRAHKLPVPHFYSKKLTNNRLFRSSQSLNLNLLHDITSSSKLTTAMVNLKVPLRRKHPGVGLLSSKQRHHNLLKFVAQLHFFVLHLWWDDSHSSRILQTINTSSTSILQGGLGHHGSEGKLTTRWFQDESHHCSLLSSSNCLLSRIPVVNCSRLWPSVAACLSSRWCLF